jgi:hypothetical protein
MQTFKKKHAREILEQCGINEYYKIDKLGVWPKAKRDKTDELNLFRWRPARIFRGEPGASEVAATPMLPFPFTAHQLAAFMLEGVGALVSGFYGDYESGPDLASLNAIDEDSNARTAIEQAYAARREAEKTVGACPLAFEAAAEYARKAHNVANQEATEREGVFEWTPGTNDERAIEARVRRARAVASIAELDAEMESTAAAWKREHEAWLNAMVRELLRPVLEQTAVTTAPGVAVEPDSDGPAPLTTGDIAYCFDGLHWREQGWKNTLGEVKTRKWLQPCATMRGQQGFTEARWNPVLLCAYLVQQGHVTARNVRAKFQTVDLLSPWFDAWKTYEVDNLDTP